MSAWQERGDGPKGFTLMIENLTKHLVCRDGKAKQCSLYEAVLAHKDLDRCPTNRE